MRHFMNVYKAYFKLMWARYLAYRVELVIWLIQLIIRPVIFLVVWASAARVMGGSLSGFAPADFAAYFIVAMLVNHVAFAWVMFDWEPRVKNGDLSYLLIRPSHVIHFDVGANLAFKATTLPVMLATAVGLTFAFQPAFRSEPWAVAAGIPALLLGAVLFFGVAWTLAMTAFYTTQIDAINAAFFFVMLLFSGQIAPLAVMPPVIQTIARAMPFWWCIGFPTEVFLGRLTPNEVLSGIGVQAIYLVGTWGLLSLTWRRAVRTYSAVGL